MRGERTRDRDLPQKWFCFMAWQKEQALWRVTCSSLKIISRHTFVTTLSSFFRGQRTVRGSCRHTRHMYTTADWPFSTVRCRAGPDSAQDPVLWPLCSPGVRGRNVLVPCGTPYFATYPQCQCALWLALHALGMTPGMEQRTGLMSLSEEVVFFNTQWNLGKQKTLATRMVLGVLVIG